MANPIVSWLKGDHLPRRAQAAQTEPRVTERKIYYYPDQITPGLAVDHDINAAIRMGTLVHGPGASELIYRAWHQDDGNSAVYAVLRKISIAVQEAPATVFRQIERGKRDPLPDHPLQQFLERPNPVFSMRELERYKTWCKLVNGNAYWRLMPSSAGNPVEAWPISPLRIVPVTTKEDAARGIFISYYAYKYDPVKDPERIPVDEIIHFREGINDKDHRLGDSPLARVAREVMGDEEATRWQAAMLVNGGSAGMVVTVPAESTMTPEGAEELKHAIEERFTRDNRGRVGVLMGGADMKPYGFSPEQMDMKSLHRFPEERIAAVFGVPAMIVGLGAGLERSIYNNYSEARDAFIEESIIPLYNASADTLNLQLKPKFTADRNVVIDYDISEMRALQEDQDAKYRRLTEAVQAGWVRPNEARVEVGLPPDMDEDEEEPQDEVAPRRTEVEELPPGEKQRTVRDLSDLPPMLQALVELAEPSLRADLERHADRQRKTVKRRLIAGG